MRTILAIIFISFSSQASTVEFNENAVKIIKEGKVLGSTEPSIKNSEFSFQVVIENESKIYFCTIGNKPLLCIEVGQYYLNNKPHPPKAIFRASYLSILQSLKSVFYFSQLKSASVAINKPHNTCCLNWSRVSVTYCYEKATSCL